MKTETKDWIRPIICGLVVALIIWVLGKFWESGNMKKYIIDFLITFSPVISGFLVFFIYRFVRDYKKLRKFSYRHDHSMQNIQSLTQEIADLKININNLKNVITKTIEPRLPDDPLIRPLPIESGYKKVADEIAEELQKK